MKIESIDSSSEDTPPPTMVGMNKINKAKILTRKNNNVYFCFYFTKTDFSECELYYWKFDLIGGGDTKVEVEVKVEVKVKDSECRRK